MSSNLISKQMRNPLILFAKIDGGLVAGQTLTTDGVLFEANSLKITEVSAGVYDLIPNDPGVQVCSAMATPITAGTTCRIDDANTNATKVRVVQVAADGSTPSADGDFYCWVAVFKGADQI